MTVPVSTTSILARPRDRVMLAAGVAIAAAIFLVDLAQPLGNAIGILYILVIVLGLWIEWPPYPMAAALVATGLLMIDLATGWTSAVPSAEFVNRPLMVLVFTSTAVLVTRFKRLERRAFSNVQQLEDLKRALDAAVIVATTDVSGRITYVNDKFCEISQYSRSELLGQDHRIINSALHSKEFIRNLWRTIASGQVWHGEIRNRAKDGHFYWVDTTIVPFLNERGKPYQYIAIRADITARREAEARLAHQASLARVGQLAAVVAHEVKNPLAGVKGAVQVLMSRRPATDPEQQVMRDIVSRIDALNELIGDLLVYARPRSPRLMRVDLRHLLEQAVSMLRRDPLGSAIRVSIEGEEIAVEADAELIRATVLNLLINAAQALNGDGEIAIALTRHDQSAVVDIRDNGPGIPDHMREQVFEPFVTTKARGGGLGLPIARRTAELHGGSLVLVSPLGGGTLMRLKLPLQPGPADGSGGEAPSEVAANVRGAHATRE
jgi:PAS domain S-box-containing protein